MNVREELHSLVQKTVNKSGMCTIISVEIEIVVQSLSTSSDVVLGIDTVRISRLRKDTVQPVVKLW